MCSVCPNKGTWLVVHPCHSLPLHFDMPWHSCIVYACTTLPGRVGASLHGAATAARSTTATWSPLTDTRTFQRCVGVIVVGDKGGGERAHARERWLLRVPASWVAVRHMHSLRMHCCVRRSSPSHPRAGRGEPDDGGGTPAHQCGYLCFLRHAVLLLWRH
jgi:hypothetical protein